jgi:hypothetical protein
MKQWCAELYFSLFILFIYPCKNKLELLKNFCEVFQHILAQISDIIGVCSRN